MTVRSSDAHRALRLFVYLHFLPFQYCFTCFRYFGVTFLSFIAIFLPTIPPIGSAVRVYFVICGFFLMSFFTYTACVCVHHAGITAAGSVGQSVGQSIGWHVGDQIIYGGGEHLLRLVRGWISGRQKLAVGA